MTIYEIYEGDILITDGDDKAVAIREACEFVAQQFCDEGVEGVQNISLTVIAHSENGATEEVVELPVSSIPEASTAPLTKNELGLK